MLMKSIYIIRLRFTVSVFQFIWTFRHKTGKLFSNVK